MKVLVSANTCELIPQNYIVLGTKLELSLLHRFRHDGLHLLHRKQWLQDKAFFLL